MTKVTLQNITKRFNQITALNDVSFSIENGEFFVLLGKTGAGKTTTLRVICGLEQQETGHVLFDDKVYDAYSPADRDTAIVFQQYSLYPNMTVYENLAFPLKAPLRKYSKDRIDERIQEVAKVLHITHLLQRKTAKLSGGEMQRVSIGRAIVREPRIFLMDEPLSNLDAKLRETLRVELQHLQKQKGVTMLFVTHDQVEAMTMADRIGVLDRGRLIQLGSPEDIYDRPGTTFVAQLVGTPRINLIKAERENGHLRLTGSQVRLPVPPEINSALRDKFQFGIRPEDVRLVNGTGEFNGQIVLTEPIGVETIVHIQTGEQTLVSTVPGISTLKLGDVVHFDLNKARAHYFDTEGQRVVGKK
jgi:multiple sugar transport system ATP-binding protein